MKLIKIVSILLTVVIIFLAARYVLYHVSYRLLYQETIEKYSSEYNIDEYLMMAIINSESSFNKNAVSSAGAKGLMQLTDSTAQSIAKSMGNKSFTVEDLYDPETNIKMGAWYLNNLKQEFSSTELVLAAYNAGRGNVAKWLGNSIISNDGKDYKNIPFAETKNYIASVLNKEKMYRFLY